MRSSGGGSSLPIETSEQGWRGSIAMQLPDVPQSPQQDRVTESARYLSAPLHEVPALVIACTEEKGGAAGWPPSIYPAVWSFMLALRSRGLGSCITTAHLHHREEADALLD